MQKVHFQLFCFSTNFNFDYIFLEGMTGAIFVILFWGNIWQFFSCWSHLSHTSYPCLAPFCALVNQFYRSVMWPHKISWISAIWAPNEVFYTWKCWVFYTPSTGCGFSGFCADLKKIVFIFLEFSHDAPVITMVAIFQLKWVFLNFQGEYGCFSWSFVYIWNPLFKLVAMVSTNLRLIKYLLRKLRLKWVCKFGRSRSSSTFRSTAASLDVFFGCFLLSFLLLWRLTLWRYLTQRYLIAEMNLQLSWETWRLTDLSGWGQTNGTLQNFWLSWETWRCSELTEWGQTKGTLQNFRLSWETWRCSELTGWGQTNWTLQAWIWTWRFVSCLF